MRFSRRPMSPTSTLAAHTHICMLSRLRARALLSVWRSCQRCQLVTDRRQLLGREKGIIGPPPSRRMAGYSVCKSRYGIIGQRYCFVWKGWEKEKERESCNGMRDMLTMWLEMIFISARLFFVIDMR